MKFRTDHSFYVLEDNKLTRLSEQPVEDNAGRPLVEVLIKDWRIYYMGEIVVGKPVTFVIIDPETEKSFPLNTTPVKEIL